MKCQVLVGMGGFSVDLRLNLTIGEAGYISIQECDGPWVWRALL